MLVLLAVFASLRWGELMGLRKTDFDLAVGLVQVERSVSLVGTRQLIKQPKTPAAFGRSRCRCGCCPIWNSTSRTTRNRSADGRVFVGPKGVTPARPNFSPIWARALAKASMSGVHFHDLRHAGNHFAAVSGASMRELMGRMGHVSVNAAMVYQHRTASRDRAIADSLDAMVAALKAEDSGVRGTLGARRLDSGGLRFQP